MERRLASSLLQIVGEPTAMTTLALAGVIVGTQSPRTGVEHFVLIGIMDVLVKDILRQLTMDEEKLRVMMESA